MTVVEFIINKLADNDNLIDVYMELCDASDEIKRMPQKYTDVSDELWVKVPSALRCKMVDLLILETQENVAKTLNTPSRN